MRGGRGYNIGPLQANFQNKLARKKAITPKKGGLLGNFVENVEKVDSEGFICNGRRLMGSLRARP
jgi:hypothetical protein